ncbi:methyl-accepting chemotaxis protein [Curvibacter sp. CHRR-16]|uniref:methyl-accepting chemotaxis protein n=1 Tax=Curvibacter sp. CHRR-16 TaxID=2835872 RepID=UPI001BD99117|nr:methyl-accepting chemotaxis protein [Curvibacter sp. CHRR-16]MBT0571563.1 methyl-accepting chemotaxis protein [Curvibacter sp. CHRR-16]
MRLGQRFMVLAAVVLAGFFLFGGWTFYALSQLKLDGPVYQKIVQAKDLTADILPPPLFIVETYLVTTQAINAPSSEQEKLFAQLPKLQKDFWDRKQFWDQQSLPQEVKEPLELAAKQAKIIFDLINKEVVPSLKANDISSVNLAMIEIQKAYDLHWKANDAMVKAASSMSDQAMSSGSAIADVAVWGTLLTWLVMAAVVAVLLWLIARSVIQQIGADPQEVVQLAREIEQGDLSHSVVQTHAGSIMDTLNRMQLSLRSVVSGVRSSADQVATASSEIAQGNQDLSARTESQASSLEQTTSAIAKMGDAVAHNAQSAQTASQLAQSASGVAVRGGEVVSQVVETMKGINEASSRIADIISVIDGIAFQTNILALNAAVEAARAGEQGRGFAVVASEVRALAGRSAEAAKEIKTLIAASVSRVEQGSALVDQAGSTMTEVVSSIQRVTALMQEISAASAEQAQGMRHVSNSVLSMDKTTQQNAALVEQMAAAASALQSQSSELVRAVSTFKLDAMGSITASAAALVKPLPMAAKPAATQRLSLAAKPVVKPVSKAASTAALPKPLVVKVDTSRPAVSKVADSHDDWESF